MIHYGRVAALVIVAAAAFAVAFALRPAPMEAAAGFDALVGFYVVTQAVERLIAMIFWAVDVPEANKKSVGLVLGFTFGALASGFFGLYFLGAVTDFDPDGGGGVNRAVDAIITGLVVAGGSKPLHDLITTIAARKEAAKQDLPERQKALV